MFRTSIGAFDGNAWEELCQLVFKRKYASDGYQEIKATPGDFGLEGFTLLTNCGFQCYCPDKHYASKELYEAQRDKITRDLGKLRTYEEEISSRIGGMRIKHWVFVTPELDRNSLLAHARTKEQEVRGWGLAIIDPDFCIQLRDANYYISEINEIRAACGEALVFDLEPPRLAPLDAPPEEYEGNVRRKSEKRLEPKKHSPKYCEHVEILVRRTLDDFLSADHLLKRIEEGAPGFFYRVLRIITEFEKNVVVAAATWTGSAEELTEHVQTSLASRLSAELGTQCSDTLANQIARHFSARWIAVCQLDYE